MQIWVQSLDREDPLEKGKAIHSCFRLENSMEWIGGHGNPLQYSCLENPMDSGGWWAIAHGVAKSQAQLSD